MKRLFDTLAGAIGLMCLIPVLALVSLQVRRKIGRPVLFRQVRPGLHGRPFMMYKFRTMTDENFARRARTGPGLSTQQRDQRVQT